MIAPGWKKSGTVLYVGETVAGVVVTECIATKVVDAMNAVARGAMLKAHLEKTTEEIMQDDIVCSFCGGVERAAWMTANRDATAAICDVCIGRLGKAGLYAPG